MKFKVAIYCILFFSVFITSAYAYRVDRTRKNDSLDLIVKRNLGKSWNRFSDHTDYANEIIKWNPKITDWKNPPANEWIYVDYPYDNFVSGATWAPRLGKYIEPTEFNRVYHLSFFYAMSVGSYTEQYDGETIKSGQNFPITMGVAGSVADSDKEHFLVSSFYWARPTNGEIANAEGFSSSEVKIPGEIGGNLYYQNFSKEFQIGFYTGYDYEKLNTFNTNEIIEGAEFKNITNQLHFATIGVVKNFDIYKFNFNLKTSYSKTIESSTDGTIPLTGNKFILFLTYKTDGNLTVSGFFKRHELDGATKLEINRVGVSIGLMAL